MKRITLEELRNMTGKEGLIIQGCGGELTEWVDGINGLLTEEGILLNGAVFRDISVFENQGITCLLFPMENVKLDIGRLAIWRLKTHEDFHGTWLSDYLDNYLDREDVEMEDEYEEEMEDERE